MQILPSEATDRWMDDGLTEECNALAQEMTDIRDCDE